MIFSILPTAGERPTILEPKKDEQYHLKWGRYAIGQGNNHLHQKFLKKIELNKRFYIGDQWSGTEDVESFFKDVENQDRNRIAVVDNTIRPMVEQYRGNAIRMNINFSIQPKSPQAVNRREAKLKEALFYADIANDSDNPFGDTMKKRLAVGDDEAETRQMFDNSYVDDFARSMKYLCGYVTEKNQFVDKQVRVAEELAFSGIAVMKSFEYGGHHQFKIVPSDTFVWDRSARLYDLSDGEFWGEVIEMSSSEIYEQFPKSYSDKDKREALEKYARYCSQNMINSNTGSLASGKIPVCFMYWRDGQYDEYGYVKDRFGYEYCTKINYVYDGEDKPRYTDKDLIAPTSDRGKKIMDGEKSKKLYTDTMRMCVFVPSEIIATTGQNDNKVPDVVLEWGISTYQDTENLEFDSVKSPYKAYCWAYIDGEVASPIDDAIDPQRMINRVLSVAENQINNSRGSGIIYDKSMMEDEGEFLSNLNQSKPAGLSAKGRGIQNAAMQYDSTVKQGTQVMYEIVEMMKNSMQRTTGVNEALKGESTGNDQLVGVTQLMIQRGSLMQEPFYNAITMVFKQCIESICTMGKRIYADNQRNLAIAVGDDMAQVITISKDMRAEDFRCFVKRENSDEMLRNAADQMLLQLISIQTPSGPLIDQKRFAALFGRSTPDDVSAALRGYSKEREELQRMSAKADQQEQAQMQEQAQQEQTQQQGMMDEQQARQDITDMANRKNDREKEVMKGLSKMAGTNKQAENLFLQKAQQPA